jgi:hypothetical protein
MKMSHLTNYYKTSEFPLALSLMASGFKLSDIERTKFDERVEFCFQREPGLDQVIEEFWKGALMVNAVNFYQNLKLLKARLRNDHK